MEIDPQSRPEVHIRVAVIRYQEHYLQYYIYTLSISSPHLATCGLLSSSKPIEMTTEYYAHKLGKWCYWRAYRGPKLYGPLDTKDTDGHMQATAVSPLFECTSLESIGKPPIAHKYVVATLSLRRL